MTRAALRLSEEEGLPADFGRGRFLRIQRAIHSQLRRRREVEQRLELGHELDLTAALEWIHSFFGGDHRIAVEVGGTLLELRPVAMTLEDIFLDIVGR